MEPVGYLEFLKLMERAYLVLADSNAYRGMVKGVNPYGDGRAAQRIVNSLLGLSSGRTQQTQQIQ